MKKNHLFFVLFTVFVCVLIAFASCTSTTPNTSETSNTSGDISVPDNSESDADVSADMSEEPAPEESEEAPVVSEEPAPEESEEAPVVSEEPAPEESEEAPVVSEEPVPEESEESEEESENEMEPVDVPIISINLHEGVDRVHKSYYVGATIQIKDPSRVFDTLYDAEAEIKIRGNSTSSGAKKPYNFRLSESENVLGLGKSKKWYLIANLYDKTLMRNKLAYDFAQVCGLLNTSKSTYVDVFLDGQFLGNYLLCESIGVGEDRVDINIDNNEFLFEFEPWVGYSNPAAFKTPVCGILLGYNDRDDATEEQKEYLTEFFTAAEDALKKKDWETVSKYFDIDSFVNHYLLNEVFKNVDIGTSSTRYYIKDNVLYAGPVWDLDLSSGNADADYYKGYNNVGGSGDSTEGLYVSGVHWYKYLIRIDEFKEILLDRFNELFYEIENLYSKNELGESRIDVLIAKYGESFEKNFTVAPWRVADKTSELERIPDATFEENVEYLRTWLEKRHKWLIYCYDLEDKSEG